MSNNCSTIAPGQKLTPRQEFGLDLVARIGGGRDVVFAIDLTQSVNLNDEGRIRLRQIIEDSLESGDLVYVVTFASSVNPANVDNEVQLPEPIEFNSKKDIDKILEKVPWQANLNFRNTDIQKAELYTYRGLARKNQCRLQENEAIKPQSIVWLTDAPLLTERGISSNDWIETPADSPFRQFDSPESIERESWLKALPYQQRFLDIDNYRLTVVDIPPTVQEFCTPAPGGKETCLVNSYIIQQLLLPIIILIVLLISSGIGLKYFFSLKKPWTLKVTYTDDEDGRKQTCSLANKKKIAIGGEHKISCPGEEIRAYLKRVGNQLYLEPTKGQLIYYNGKKLSQSQKIQNDIIKLNCPNNSRNFNIVIKIVQR